MLNIKRNFTKFFIFFLNFFNIPAITSGQFEYGPFFQFGQSQCNYNSNHNFVIGRKTQNDRLIFTEYPYAQGIMGFTEREEVIFPNGFFNQQSRFIVTKIEVLNRGSKANGACIRLISGGINQRFVNLRIISQQSRGFTYMVRIYGRRSSNFFNGNGFNGNGFNNNGFNGNGFNNNGFNGNGFNRPGMDISLDQSGSNDQGNGNNNRPQRPGGDGSRPGRFDQSGLNNPDESRPNKFDQSGSSNNPDGPRPQRFNAERPDNSDNGRFDDSGPNRSDGSIPNISDNSAENISDGSRPNRYDNARPNENNNNNESANDNSQNNNRQDNENPNNTNENRFNGRNVLQDVYGPQGYDN